MEELLVETLKDSPTIAIIGYIAYLLRNDLREYMVSCRQDINAMIDKLVDKNR